MLFRSDLLSFAGGGNKVRKMQMIAAEARAEGADTLITCGGVQSNHARVTAGAGAALGLDVVLVLNPSTGSGQAVHPSAPTGNLRLDHLFGAEIRYVTDRADRVPAMDAVAAQRRAAGRRPFVVPLGASTPAGAIGFARGVAEVLPAGVKPVAIVHASSSGGTQAGMIAGCALLGLRARVIGISADADAAELSDTVKALLTGVAARLGGSTAAVGADRPIEVDDRFVGDGYGIPTEASTDAQSLLARTEGIVLDPVYTAKAMAGLLARIRDGEFAAGDTVLFWHTGGVPGYFA